MRRDIFQAIADPVRRDIIKLLAEQRLTVNAVAERFEVSRPAISKHLKILEECGVIAISKRGRERLCHIRPGSLIPAFMWIEQYRELWEQRLDSFEDYVNKLKAKTYNNEKNE